jgi:hypothetical protein
MKAFTAEEGAINNKGKPANKSRGILERQN